MIKWLLNIFKSKPTEKGDIVYDGFGGVYIVEDNSKLRKLN